MLVFKPGELVCLYTRDFHPSRSGQVYLLKPVVPGPNINSTSFSNQIKGRPEFSLSQRTVLLWHWVKMSWTQDLLKNFTLDAQITQIHGQGCPCHTHTHTERTPIVWSYAQTYSFTADWYSLKKTNKLQQKKDKFIYVA